MNTQAAMHAPSSREIAITQRYIRFWGRLSSNRAVLTVAAAEGWLAAQRALWEARTDRLEQFVTSARKKEKSS